MNGISYNASIATVGRIVVNLLGLIVIRVLTSLLGVEGFGYYSTIFAYLFFISIIADLGLGTLLTREISRPSADMSRIVGSLVLFRLILFLAVALFGLILVYFFPYPVVVKLGILVTTVTVCAQSISQMFIGVFQKELRIGVVAVADVITRLIQLTGLCLLWWGGSAFLLPVLWVNVVAELVHVGYLWVATRRIVEFRLHVDVAYWKEIFRHALPIGASLLFTLVYFKIDTIMLSLMRTPVEVGNYALAYKVLEIVIFFPAMYVGLVMPLLSRYANEWEQFSQVFRKAFWVLIGTGVATVVAIVLWSSTITHLLGGELFPEAGRLLQILSIAIGFIFLGNLGGNAIIALNIQRQGMWIYALGAILNVGANMVLIPHFGAFGAAWATVATEAVVTVGMFLLIWRASAYRAVRP